MKTLLTPTNFLIVGLMAYLFIYVTDWALRRAGFSSFSI